MGKALAAAMGGMTMSFEEDAKGKGQKGGQNTAKKAVFQMKAQQ